MDFINPIILKTVEIPYTVLSGSDLNWIKELILVLKPLEFMTKQVSGKNYATASIVIPLLFCCSQQLQNIKISFQAKEIKDVLVAKLKRRFGKVEQCRPIAFATLLDPRFKNVDFQDPVACGTAIMKL